MRIIDTEALRFVAKLDGLPPDVGFMMLDIAEEIDLLRNIAEDLEARVVWLVETFPGWAEDDTFTFPDGDVWRKDTYDGD